VLTTYNNAQFLPGSIRRPFNWGLNSSVHVKRTFYMGINVVVSGLLTPFGSIIINRITNRLATAEGASFVAQVLLIS
jgi:fumarate reductase subunit D